MLKKLLYWCVEMISKAHTYILQLNDAYEYQFSDKELHFLVIGLLGMGMVVVIYPFFKWLAKHGHEMVITWIYVFTLIVVITFAIEIGQSITHTGTMEFADIVFGLVGFILMFAVFSLVRSVIHLIVDGFRRSKRRRN